MTSNAITISFSNVEEIAPGVCPGANFKELVEWPKYERLYTRKEWIPGSSPGRINSLRSLNRLSGGNSKWVPPDPISNSEVKLLSADGSMGFPYARVGHCQALNTKPLMSNHQGFFFLSGSAIIYGRSLTEHVAQASFSTALRSHLLPEFGPLINWGQIRLFVKSLI